MLPQVAQTDASGQHDFRVPNELHVPNELRVPKELRETICPADGSFAADVIIDVVIALLGTKSEQQNLFINVVGGGSSKRDHI